MWQQFDSGYLGWSGSRVAFTDLIKNLLAAHDHPFATRLDAPSIKQIQTWHTSGIFSQPRDSNYGYRQIIECLTTIVLRRKGRKIIEIVALMKSKSTEELLRNLLGADHRMPQQLPGPILDRESYKIGKDAEIATTLLAQGVLKAYERVLSGKYIIRQDDTFVPSELYAAMSRLGRLYLEEGKEDRAACVHDILARCKKELRSSDWGIAAFANEDFGFGTAILVDPIVGVPTGDCLEIARLSRSSGELNVLEDRFHRDLMEAAERMRSRKHETYSLLRGFIGRHPLIHQANLLDFIREKQLSYVQHIIEDFYTQAPACWTFEGNIYQCQRCGAMLRPHADKKAYPQGICPVRQCNLKGFAGISKVLLHEPSWLTAKDPLLVYWVGPAIDELSIYDAAIARGLDAILYPDSDACDISINGTQIGIDAKSYSSPITLAMKLSRSIGGLIAYRRRIIAVSDEMVAREPRYIPRLQAAIRENSEAKTLEIMTVSAVKKMTRRL